MKLERIRISYTNTPSTQLIYKIEVMITFNKMERILAPKKYRIYTFVGDIDNWWDEKTMEPVYKNRIKRFLNRTAADEERRNR